MNNLKQVGLAILMYANDYNGWSVSDYMTGGNWSDLLVNNGYVARKICGCPSQPPTMPTGTYSYGIRHSSDRNIGGRTLDTAVCPSGTRNSYYYYIERVKDPSNYLFIADSVYYSVVAHSNPAYRVLSSNEYYYYRWRATWDAFPGMTLDAIHLRHTGVANAWFLDGHVEACTIGRLKDLGFISGCDKDLGVITF